MDAQDKLQLSVNEVLKVLFDGKVELNVKSADGYSLNISELLRIIVGSIQVLTMDVNNLKGVQDENKKRKL